MKKFLADKLKKPLKIISTAGALLNSISFTGYTSFPSKLSAVKRLQRNYPFQYFNYANTLRSYFSASGKKEQLLDTWMSFISNYA